jgi:hypothetical protein
LVDQATVAAVSSGQHADALFAWVLLSLASDEAKGDWHAMPDLITMLTTDWVVAEAGSSDGSKGWLPVLGSALGSSLKGALSGQVSAALKPAAIDMMLYSCLKPDQPLDINEVGLRADPTLVTAMCGM